MSGDTFSCLGIPGTVVIALQRALCPRCPVLLNSSSAVPASHPSLLCGSVPQVGTVSVTSLPVLLSERIPPFSHLKENHVGCRGGLEELLLDVLIPLAHQNVAFLVSLSPLGPPDLSHVRELSPFRFDSSQLWANCHAHCSLRVSGSRLYRLLCFRSGSDAYSPLSVFELGDISLSSHLSFPGNALLFPSLGRLLLNPLSCTFSLPTLLLSFVFLPRMPPFALAAFSESF